MIAVRVTHDSKPRGVTMLSTYFPDRKTLKARLEKRFLPTLDSEAAKQVVIDASEASWSGDAEIKQRKADLQRALQYLESNADSEVAYLRVAVDLQISKASALRTYCSILVAVSVFSSQLAQNNWSYGWLLCAIILAVTAALLTISTSWTSWPEDEYFETSAKESHGLVALLAGRGCRVNLAVIGSIVATLAWAAAFAPIAYTRFKANEEAAQNTQDATERENESGAQQTPPGIQPGVTVLPDIKPKSK
jgi:hypothetical protein